MALPGAGHCGLIAANNPYSQLKWHRLATAKDRLSRCPSARGSVYRAEEITT